MTERHCCLEISAMRMHIGGLEQNNREVQEWLVTYAVCSAAPLTKPRLS